jgi:hypothetical protein
MALCRLILSGLFRYQVRAANKCRLGGHMKLCKSTTGYLSLFIAILFSSVGCGTVEDQVYIFDVCGAPNSREPGWVPHGDPMVNGKMTIVLNADEGLLTLTPSPELLQSTRYVTLHAHLYDLKHRYENTDIGQSTICWAYYNTNIRGGTCARDDYDCQALTGVKDWPWPRYGYSVDWYKDYLKKVARENAEGWFLMYHSAGGHFATDEDDHLIEWDGSAAMEASFLGNNNKRDACNAHVGRTLADKDFGTGDTCNRMLRGVMADDYFLDGNGVSWLDKAGNLTEDATLHGYNLETEYLYYNYRDNGQSDRWGGPDGGAGGFITGDAEGRCANWPPTAYGDPHIHEES